VIPSDWALVHRADGEHVGYLVRDGGPGMVVAHLLTGTPHGPAATPASAHARLVDRGLVALDQRWWCRLPTPLPPGRLQADVPQPGWEWRPVVVVEVSPTECRVRPEWPAPEELTAQAVLPVPVAELLLADPP
jgi:hypothetical protein